MNESKNNVPTMYQTIPAVAAMNHVPGFEPMKLLRRTKSRKGNEVVWKLALPYKKLWFRLVNPNGRIKLNALSVTEQMAVYEAQVFLDRNDTNPVSSFTASCSKENMTVEDYIRAAQEEAIDEALSLAGFGPQFADIGMTKAEERYGSEIPLSAIPAEKTPINVSPATSTAPVTKTVVPGAQISASVVKEEDSLPVPAVVEAKPTTEARAAEKPMEAVQPTGQKPVSQGIVSEAQRAMQILQRNPNAVQTSSAQATSTVTPNQTMAATPPKYTRDTPVPEIVKLMTIEEAREVVVDTGTCQGWTMAEVAERRPASLKFYLFGGYKEGNNILLAAARLLYDQMQMQKAG